MLGSSWGLCNRGSSKGSGGEQAAKGLVPQEICVFATLRPSAKKIWNDFINRVIIGDPKQQTSSRKMNCTSEAVWPGKRS